MTGDEAAVRRLFPLSAQEQRIEGHRYWDDWCGDYKVGEIVHIPAAAGGLHRLWLKLRLKKIETLYRVISVNDGLAELEEVD